LAHQILYLSSGLADPLDVATARLYDAVEVPELGRLG